MDPRGRISADLSEQAPDPPADGTEVGFFPLLYTAYTPRQVHGVLCTALPYPYGHAYGRQGIGIPTPQRSPQLTGYATAPINRGPRSQMTHATGQNGLFVRTRVTALARLTADFRNRAVKRQTAKFANSCKHLANSTRAPCGRPSSSRPPD